MTTVMRNMNPNDILVGAAAGVVATVPMTIVMEELHHVLPGEHDGPLPPREVTESIYNRVAPENGNASEEDLERMTVFGHYAFGGAAGAVFPLIAPRPLAAAIGAGMLYGLAVWTGAYLATLPALGVRHHARQDPPGRNAMMIAAHVVWGATLGLLVGVRPGLRAASRRP